MWWVLIHFSSLFFPGDEDSNKSIAFLIITLIYTFSSCLEFTCYESRLSLLSPEASQGLEKGLTQSRHSINKGGIKELMD